MLLKKEFDKLANSTTRKRMTTINVHNPHNNSSIVLPSDHKDNSFVGVLTKNVDTEELEVLFVEAAAKLEAANDNDDEDIEDDEYTEEIDTMCGEVSCISTSIRL